MGFETPGLCRHRVRADDGWVLDVAELAARPDALTSSTLSPDGIKAPKAEASCVVICGHAMMVDRRTILRDDRPSLARSLSRVGCHVLVPDLRGHGMSGPTPRHGGRWSYGDLVSDVGVFVDFARRRFPDLPVALVGHSLFGHLALAWLSGHPASATSIRALALLAVNMWHPQAWGAAQPTLQRAEKRATMLATKALSRLLGYLPSTWLSPRAMDESALYWSALYDSAIRGRWGQGPLRDTGYRTALAGLHTPTLHIVSEGDRVNANPAEADAFLQPLPKRTLWHLGSGAPQLPTAVSKLSPDHMRMVTHPSSEPLWEAVAAWLHKCATEAR